MSDKRDILEKITEIPENNEPKLELLNEAKKIAIKMYGDTSEKRTSIFRQRWIKLLTCVLAPCFLFIVIITPILLHKQKDVSIEPLKFFTFGDLIYENIESIDDYLVEQNLQLHTLGFEMSQASTKKYLIKDTGELAYIQQQLLVFGADYFDIVECYIVPFKGDFEVFTKYKNLQNIMQYEETEVKYNEILNEENSYTTDATLVYKEVTYNLTIQSEKAGQLMTYIDNLLR